MATSSTTRSSRRPQKVRGGSGGSDDGDVAVWRCGDVWWWCGVWCVRVLGGSGAGVLTTDPGADCLQIMKTFKLHFPPSLASCQQGCRRPHGCGGAHPDRRLSWGGSGVSSEPNLPPTHACMPPTYACMPSFLRSIWGHRAVLAQAPSRVHEAGAAGRPLHADPAPRALGHLGDPGWRPQVAIPLHLRDTRTWCTTALTSRAQRSHRA